MGFLEALQDPKISEIVLLGDVVLDPRGSGERDPILITRNVTITSPPGTPRSSLPALDFSFQQDEATIGVNVTVTFKSVMLKNMRKGSGLGMDFFGGLQGSTIVCIDVPRWRYMCAAADAALASANSYPRPSDLPGKNLVRLQNEYHRGTWYNSSLHYVSFALHVMSDNSESDAWLPGYAMVLRNSTRICQTYISPECESVKSLDQCQVDGVDAWLAAMDDDTQDESWKQKVAAGVASGVGAALVLAAGAFVWRRRRLRRRRMAWENEAADPATFGG
ncbi:hypothetical protein MNEG_12316 [Monoraphidium neglectum]|uniref:Uncharacterized protein n=1 Tax=Monoraphidium neglectum TaxID=145388 RepID=A0A0D2M2X3_9CHLO|nr:hypothetical protein MNEG_12316 [Monoraphidium neglectum]KIY95646.1 hypothetical protein MNEG_12316 [Monoraphidium neglectum]|eukprot:XP_013894666.1 hypothetical protein MNEG_12316 [Monoraphidium neglectum]